MEQRPHIIIFCEKNHQLHVRCRSLCSRIWPKRKYRVMVMVNGKWWPQKVILVPLASPSGGRRKDWRAQWRQWYISFFTFLLLSFSSFCSFPQLRAQEGQQNIFFVFLIESTMQAVEFFSPVFFLSFLYLNAFPFASCFLLLQQCGLKKGFQSFLFLWKKKQKPI